MYCNDYMLEQGPETMVKYAKGKGASLENAKSSAQHFIDGFIHLQGMSYTVMMLIKLVSF